MADEADSSGEVERRAKAAQEFFDALKRIKPPAEPPLAGDPRAREEKAVFAKAGKKEELEEEEYEQEVRARRHYHEDRKRYTSRIYWLMVGWFIAVLAIVVFAGLEFPCWRWLIRFELSDAVLLGLIGSTTANVIGLFVIVARYLFPRTSVPTPIERTRPSGAPRR